MAFSRMGHGFNRPNTSSKKHGFIIVATDNFTKWTEAKLMKKVTQESVITFIKENIIHRFRLPQMITVDRGTVFTGGQIREFAKEYKFEIVNSTLYYAQANGQAKATNKSIKHIMERAIEDTPNDWHQLLSEDLWAFRTSPNRAKMSIKSFILDKASSLAKTSERRWLSKLLKTSRTTVTSTFEDEADVTIEGQKKALIAI
ncbi:hypothetical protein RJ640_009889 [Escallonia rubra]|uniref:Integrase catalytic domain-containing protein n=1 Tax=Escallonia rubra TaxID=112253 RepID=A0AA88QWY4_9ASTE|nr:hypothetical protein RJ640_009889 [Escallonia rubra]